MVVGASARLRFASARRGWSAVKKEKSFLLAKIKSEPIFFPVLWQFFLKGVPVFLKKAVAGGRGLGGTDARKRLYSLPARGGSEMII